MMVIKEINRGLDGNGCDYGRGEMNHRKAVNTENLKPFKKGADSRRNKGNKNAEAQSFSIQFRNALAKKLSADKIADILIAEVERKRPWAIQEFLDRLMGKSTQPLEHSGEVNHAVFMMPRPKKKKENAG